LPWQPFKVEKSGFSQTNLLCRTAIRKPTAISHFLFQNVQYEFLYIVYNFGVILSRNLRVYTVNNSTFCGDTAKIGISRKISEYPGPILTYFTCLVGVLVGMITKYSFGGHPRDIAMATS